MHLAINVPMLNAESGSNRANHIILTGRQNLLASLFPAIHFVMFLGHICDKFDAMSATFHV